MKGYMLALLAAALVPAAFLQPAFAQGMNQPSSGGSLDIEVDPQWGQDAQAQIKVSFLQPGSQTVQEHIDYDVKIADSSGNEVFSAAGQVNQPTLHTAEGVVTIPYKFEGNGDYTITVEMTGIQFIPITPETAEFPVNVTPEFPAGALSAVAVTAGAIAVARMKKL
ncbi:MAG: hypothetical protein QXJ74_01240 [Nitrososphaera sp.]|uniref:hypothetical protein n=1 Tax=Nitrososphaera sp. TaxID=1971748 RepID=UPI0017CE6EC9|nr:hypothetical protein [Nitrososphaera sp.]NWG37389.1 hypothetical protein [Nitrososphaera sp.]